MPTIFFSVISDYTFVDQPRALKLKKVEAREPEGERERAKEGLTNTPTLAQYAHTLLRRTPSPTHFDARDNPWPCKNLMHSKLSGILYAAVKRNYITGQSNSLSRRMASKLRLLQFCESGGGKQRVGVEVEGGRVVDVTAVDPSIPTDMRTFLQGFDANSTAATK